MPFKSGFRRTKSAETTNTWTEKLESIYVEDHPRHPSSYNIYLPYIAFLTAGIVEHHWTEGIKANGRAPFEPLERPDDFLPDLHKKIRAFRESRHIDGRSSPELVRHSYELLGFLAERVPRGQLDRYLATARTYLRQNEDECLAS